MYTVTKETTETLQNMTKKVKIEAQKNISNFNIINVIDWESLD